MRALTERLSIAALEPAPVICPSDVKCLNEAEHGAFENGTETDATHPLN
jgi:hypothetical protein